MFIGISTEWSDEQIKDVYSDAKLIDVKVPFVQPNQQSSAVTVVVQSDWISGAVTVWSWMPCDKDTL